MTATLPATFLLMRLQQTLAVIGFMAEHAFDGISGLALWGILEYISEY